MLQNANNTWELLGSERDSVDGKDYMVDENNHVSILSQLLGNIFYFSKSKYLQTLACSTIITSSWMKTCSSPGKMR